MATLAPNIPQQGDPEYLRYSHPIGSVEGDKSGAYLAKIGEDVAQGADTAEKIIANYTKQTAFQEGQKLEDEHKEALRPVWEQYKSLDNPNASTENEAQPLSFLGDSMGSLIQGNKELPQEIRSGTRQAQATNERFSNGKMSQTQYDMEIDSLAKDLNSRFPAWHQEIQQGLSKATGRANANQTVSDMIGDINRIQGQLNSQANKQDTHIMNGLKDVADPQLRDAILQNHFGKRQGDPGYMDGLTALHHVLTGQAFDINQKRRETANSIAQSQNAVDKIKVGRDLNSALADTVDNWKQNIMIRNGAKTWDELQDKIREVQANPDSVEGQKLANDVAQSLGQLKAEMYKNSRFAARTMGTDADKRLEEASNYFDRLAKDAVGGDVSKLGNIVSSAGNAAAAMQQNAKLGWLKVPGFGGALADYEALNSIAPEVAKTYLDTFQSVVKGAGETIGNHFQETMTKGMSVPPGPPKNNNKPININQRIDEAHTMGANPQTLQGYINFVDNIKTMPPSQARNLAYAYYGPENRDMIGKWARDAYNPRTGQTAEGQGTILQKMGDKGILDKIWSLNDPKLNGHVQNFLESSVSNWVFPSLMKELEGTSKFGLAYDNKTQQFVIRNYTEQGLAGPLGPLSFSHGISNYAQATQTVKQLNNVSQVVKNLASHLGKDPNAYMVELFSAGNPNVGAEAHGTPAETESAAVRALANQVLAKKIKEEKKPKE